MTITDLSGPIVVFQDGGILTNSSANQNPDQGPSLFLQGIGILDPRKAYTFFPGMGEGPLGFNSAGVAIAALPAVGWLNSRVLAVDYAPSAVATANIAALQAQTADTALTLVSSTGSGITVSDSITNAATGATVTGLLRIDNTPGNTTFGQSGAIAIWNPAAPALGRAVSLTSGVGDLRGTTFTIAGYDAYGYSQTEAIAGPNTAATVNTAKTFKWIASVTPDTTDAVNTVSVGTADIYGLPIRADSLFYLDAFWNGIRFATSSDLIFTAADTTDPATTTTNDVRGTLNINAAGGGTVSNGTIKLQVAITVPVANISSLTGLFGITPV